MEITTELEDGDADSEDNGDKQLTISGIQMLLERALSTYNSSVHKYKTLLHQEQEVRGKVLNVSAVELHWLEHLWDHGNFFETRVVRATMVRSK